MRDDARRIAGQLRTAYDEAEAAAAAVRQIQWSATERSGADLSTWHAAINAGGDLLAGLGGIAKVDQIAGSAQVLRELSDERDDAAVAAQEAMRAAIADADAIPVDRLTREVAIAEEAVESARTALEALSPGMRSTRIGTSEVHGQLSAQGWVRPVGGRITDRFGPRPQKPLPGVNPFHRGTDIGAACGNDVLAASGGVVAEAGWNGTYGNWILLDHGSGVATGYAHLAEDGIYAALGQRVVAGQPIGAVGTTGASTGCHLHYEVRVDGQAIDAEPFMAARGATLGEE
jgi:murein DD-endopeptidase MepM/ murein hydrolase activator NlpD